MGTPVRRFAHGCVTERRQSADAPARRSPAALGALKRRAEAGAPRIDNRSGEPVRLLVLRTTIAPEVVEYRTQAGCGAARTSPASTPAPGDTQVMGRSGEEIDYLEGET